MPVWLSLVDCSTSGRPRARCWLKLRLRQEPWRHGALALPKTDRRVNAQSTDQARRLQGFIDDLTAVLALQSASSGCMRDDILASLGMRLWGSWIFVS
jgi:hypothetical protein